MMEYIAVIIAATVFTCLVLLGLWSLWLVMCGLFGDMIIRRQQINESRKKWKK